MPRRVRHYVQTKRRRGPEYGLPYAGGNHTRLRTGSAIEASDARVNGHHARGSDNDGVTSSLSTAPIELPAGVSPRIFADRLPAVRRVIGVDVPVTSDLSLNGHRGGAASKELGSDPVSIFNLMVAEQRETAAYDQQTAVYDVFFAVDDNAGADELFAAVQRSGLRDSRLGFLDRLGEHPRSRDLSLDMFEEVFGAVAEGVASTYLDVDEVLLSPNHIANFLEPFVGTDDKVVRPDGVLVDKNSKAVLVYKAILSPGKDAIAEATSGLKAYGKLFRALTGGSEDPQLVLISPPLRKDLVVDAEVEHIPVNVTMDDIARYIHDNAGSSQKVN